MVTSTTVQTRVIQHTGVKPLVLAGTALGAIAMFLFTRLTPGSSYASDVLPGLLVLGVGMGCIFAPAFSTATLGVEGREAGVASAMVNTSQQIGGSVGTSLLSTIFASAVASYTADHLHTTVAIVILPGPAIPRVPTVKAALARLAIGNCHYSETADGDRHVLGANARAARAAGKLAQTPSDV